jgi:hypothetical protein
LKAQNELVEKEKVLDASPEKQAAVKTPSISNKTSAP